MFNEYRTQILDIVDGLKFKEFVLSTYTTLGIKSKLFLLLLNLFFDIFTRCEKYSSKLDIFHSFIRIFAVKSLYLTT